MEYKEFEKHILRIKAAYEKDQAISDLLGVDGLLILCDDLLDSVVDLLEREFDDESEWISYWIWELDFGKEYRPGSVMLNHRPVALATIQDLYNVLTEE